MRFVFLLLFVLASASALRSAEVEFIRLWSQWRDEESFQRIGEFFGRPENNGREIILRSQPQARDGYYFLVRVKHDQPLGGGTFALHLIRPDAPQPRVFTFAIPNEAKRRGETVFQLGLTGSDWPSGKEAQPVAWKLELISPDRRVLVVDKSFLWEKPAPPAAPPAAAEAR